MFCEKRCDFIEDDGEFFEYDAFGGQGSMATQKAFPYLESLLSFLEMDCKEWKTLMQQVSENLDQFLATNDLTYTDQVMQLLGELGEKHIYFKLLYLQWFERKARGNIEGWMAEEMRQLPEQLALYQKQAQTFLENISEEQFADWAKRAKAKKKDCDAEKISLDEFKVWLKKS